MKKLLIIVVCLVALKTQAQEDVNIAYVDSLFGQLPEEIAELYKKTNYGKTLKEIVHPIIGNNNNYDVFKKVLEKKKEK